MTRSGIEECFSQPTTLTDLNSQTEFLNFDYFFDTPIRTTLQTHTHTRIPFTLTELVDNVSITISKIYKVFGT